MPVQTDKRRQELRFNVGEMPTVPVPSTLVWGEPGFAATDIVKSEWAFVKQVDGKDKLYSRSDVGIYEIPTSEWTSAQIIALSDAIVAEASARNAALVAETAARNAAITAEQNARVDADNALQTAINNNATTISGIGGALNNEIVTREGQFAGLTDALNSHINDVDTNPHKVSLEQARSENSKIEGDILFMGNTGKGVPDPVDDEDISNKRFVIAAVIAAATEITVADLSERNAYDVALGQHVFVTDDGDGNWALYKAITAGVGATYIKLSDPDLLNAAMSSSAIKAAYESNPDTNAFTNALLSKLNAIAAGATADVKASDFETQTGTDDAKFVTSLKLANWWVNIKTLVQTFAAKITFTTAPRFDSTTASQYLKVNATKDLDSVAAIPATDVTEDTTHRFATDAEKTTWNAKQNAIGYTAANAANFVSAVKSADQATAVTSMADVTGMSFSIGANESYTFEIGLHVTTSGNNGAVFTITFPSGEAMIQFIANNTTTSNLATSIITASGTDSATVMSAVSTAGFVRLSGVIANGVTAGTVQLRFRSSNVANTVTIKKNSYLKASKN